MPAGRPSTYTPGIAEEICRRLADGESLRKLWEGADMPPRQTVLDWLTKHEDFRTRYARARELQADVMDDKVLEAADLAIAGKCDPHAAKVAIGAYQWRASKLAPKRYGDTLKLQGDAEAPLKMIVERMDRPK
jgi:hypothetical protein